MLAVLHVELEMDWVGSSFTLVYTRTLPASVRASGGFLFELLYFYGGILFLLLRHKYRDS